MLESSATVIIDAAPATVTVSGGGDFCGSTTITASNGGDGTIYFEGTTSGGTSTATPSTSEVIAASGTYYFRARSADGCWGAEGSATVNITNCCLVNSLTINTGYDPSTNSKITGLHTDNTTAVTDPKWLVTTLAPDAAAQIYAHGSTSVTPTAPADVVDDNLSPYYPSGSWAVNSACNWITSQNSHGYYTNVNSTASYTMTLTRSFTTCAEDNVTVSGQLAADNYIVSAKVDGSDLVFPSWSTITTPGDTWYGNYDVFTPFSLSIPSMSAGVHTIVIVVANYNLYNEPPYQNDYNPTGLNLYGTVTSDNNSIISETSECSSYTCPGERHSAPTTVEQPITGNLTCFPNPNGGSFTLRGALAGTTSKEASIEVIDVLGKIVYNDVVTVENGGINKVITLGNHVTNGVYLVKVKSGSSNKVIRISVQQ